MKKPLKTFLASSAIHFPFLAGIRLPHNRPSASLLAHDDQCMPSMYAINAGFYCADFT
jgi:hypothetical protein